jgi:hypothetical protein
MDRSTKKKVSVAGGITAALIILIAGALIFNSCSKNNRYEKYFGEAENYFLTGSYDKALSSLEKPWRLTTLRSAIC